MMFHVGQKVIRVSVPDSEGYGDPCVKGRSDLNLTEVGCIYTIRAVNVWSNWTALRFAELDNSHLIPILRCRIEPGFNSLGFRPIIERKTSIEVFTRMLAPTGKRELVKAKG